MNNSYSDWHIKYSVTQGSVSGSILFKSFLCDMLFLIDEIDADFMLTITPDTLWEKLFKWFNDNGKKSIPKIMQFHLNLISISQKFPRVIN